MTCSATPFPYSFLHSLRHVFRLLMLIFPWFFPPFLTEDCVSCIFTLRRFAHLTFTFGNCRRRRWQGRLRTASGALVQRSWTRSRATRLGKWARDLPSLTFRSYGTTSQSSSPLVLSVPNHFDDISSFSLAQFWRGLSSGVRAQYASRCCFLPVCAHSGQVGVVLTFMLRACPVLDLVCSFSTLPIIQMYV
jgi:hypothetical protein